MRKLTYEEVKRAINFYNYSPDGQYDEIAVLALIAYRDLHFQKETQEDKNNE